MCDVLDKVENKGKAEGKIEGKNQMALLVKKLLDQSRIEDVKRASEDETYRDKLMKELGISSTVYDLGGASSDALPLLLQDSPHGLSCFYLETHNERGKNQSPCAPANGAAKGD